MARSSFIARSLLFSFALRAAGQASVGTGTLPSIGNGPYTNSTTISSTSTSSDSSSSSSSSSISIPLGTGATTSTSSTSSSSSSSSLSSSSSSIPLGTGISTTSTSSVPLGTGVTTSSSTTLVPGAVTSPPGVTSITTAIDGTTTVVPVISGGDVSSNIVLTPTTTMAPTGTEASSSKAEIETSLSSVFPIIQGWIDDDTEDSGPIISSLDDLQDDTEDLLSKISSDSDQDTTKGCTHSLFSLLSCVIDTVSKIKTSVTDTLVETVEDELTDLKNLTEELQNEDDDQSSTTTSSTTSSSSSSSSSSCTSGTSVTEDFFVTCTPTVISSTTTQVCNTGTSTVSGCSVTASATTTTLSSSSVSLCAQTGCSSCTATTIPAAPTVQCSDCTTVDGVAYPPEATTLPAGADEVTDPNSLPTNDTLSKRTLQTPDEYETAGSLFPYSDFFQAQLAAPGLINVPHRPGGTGGSSSAVLREFDNFSRLTMTVQGLYGCTSIILVSRKSVYMSHLFENPGFTTGYNDDGTPNEGDFAADIENAVFNGDPTVINAGSTVDGEPWLPDLNALAAAGGLLDPAQDGGVRAIVVSPNPQPWQTTKYRYQTQIETIRTKLGVFDSDPMDFIYTATDDQTSNDPAYQLGKVLFQFDPAESTVFDKFMLGGDQYTCPIQYAGFKLWIGYQDYVSNLIDPYYEDNWALAVSDSATIAPLPVGGGLIVSRDDAAPNACVKDDSSSTSSTASATDSSSATGSTTSIPTTLSTVTTSSSTSSNTSTPITSSPPITSCALSTQAATVINSVSYTETLVCSCNDGWTAGVGTLSADGGTSILTCQVGTSTTMAVSTLTPTTTTSAASSTYTGACYTDVSRDEYGQCEWTGQSSIVAVGACPSSAACPSNGASCFYVDDGSGLIGCGGASSPAATSTSTTVAPITTTEPTTTSAAAPTPTGPAIGDSCVPDNPEWGCTADKTEIIYCYCGDSDDCKWSSFGQCQGGSATCHLDGDGGNCGLGFGACC